MTRTLQWVLAGVGVILQAFAFAAPPARRVTDSIAERVVPCASCHGPQGRATREGYFPRIAGKPAGYLHNQLVNFRDGRRNYPLMVYLVEHLSDDYLREMADYFETLDLPHPAPEPMNLTAANARRAEALVKQGDASRKIPACAACHGENLQGARPFMPGLLGLPRAYLGAQLVMWKDGLRRAHAPDCMAQVAAKLTLEEIGWVSSWLSAQPVPAGLKASERLPGPLPAQCGSLSR